MTAQNSFNTKMLAVLSTILWLHHELIAPSHCASVPIRSYPRYDYGGKDHHTFIHDALERASPASARLLAELFGGLELGLGLSGGQTIITVGGAATRCQHQSPCYDSKCRACYDPLLRIHGKCGGASYFTCRGSLPKPCLAHTCTYRGEKTTIRSAEGQSSALEEVVFVKKFPRYEDTYCLGIQEKARSLDARTQPDAFNATHNVIRDTNEELIPDDDPEWVMAVPDAVTPCKGYDTCIHMACGKCFDPYLGGHTTCGKMTYFDCNVSLPIECRPLMCTRTNVNEIFPMSTDKRARARSIEDFEAEEPAVDQLMVRNFAPLANEQRHCV